MLMSRARFAAAAALFLLHPNPIRADQERYFSAAYELTDAVDLGAEVRVDFVMELRNHSGADVAGATVTLRQGPAGIDALHSWGSQVLFEDGPARLSWTVTVSREQYEQWRTAGGPRVDVLWTRPDGSARLSFVEMFQGPLGRE